jgi:uroporphyrinogen decarboxylase
MSIYSTKLITNTLLLDALNCRPTPRPPIWLLRQAGRYQQAYRDLRKQEPNFLQFCKNSHLTSTAAMLPIIEYDLDAAILFSDILTIPDAMGMDLKFVENSGPEFSSTIKTNSDIKALNKTNVLKQLAYVSESIKRLNEKIGQKIPVIGFSGSPWTLACYMLEGKTSRDFSIAKRFVMTNPKESHYLMSVLSDIIIEYLDMQITAGVDAIMLFDTWGGIFSKAHYEEFSLQYMDKILAALRLKHGSYIPSIIFTKGGNNWINKIAETQCSAVAIDWTTPIADARKLLPQTTAIQGNLDPAILHASLDTITKYTLDILNNHGDNRGFIFNLGHGIIKDTDPKKVKHMVNIVKNYCYENGAE